MKGNGSKAHGRARLRAFFIWDLHAGHNLDGRVTNPGGLCETAYGSDAILQPASHAPDIPT
jgi:hypothetical protein